MKFSRQTLILAGILACSPAALAQEVDNRPNAYVGAVKYLFNGNHKQNNDLGFLVGFEAPVTDRWALALEYWDVDTENKVGPGESELSYRRLGANYHLNPINSWQPYLSLGFGDLDIERNNLVMDTDENTFDFGVGVKHFLSDNFFLRGDAKMIYVSSEIGFDYALGLGVAYAFGSKSTPTAAPVVPVTPLDSDNDGVSDRLDRCANTPAGRTVNSSGCELDSDRDGIANAADNCPNTSAQLAVDSKGCPILESSLMRQTLAVNFATNQAVISGQYDTEIREFADFMNEYANTSVVIEGHTDNDGAESYNQALSEKRAEAVMNRLIEVYNISASRLSSVGYGESRPAASNTTASGKASNRRINAEVSVQVEQERLR